jgi:SdrD B-like domain
MRKWSLATLLLMSGLNQDAWSQSLKLTKELGNHAPSGVPLPPKEDIRLHLHLEPSLAMRTVEGVYQDVILDVLPQKVAVESLNPGMPIGIVMETRLHHQKGMTEDSATASSSRSVLARGYVETENHGVLGGELDVSEETKKWKLEQSRMPLGFGWTGTHAIGNVFARPPNMTWSDNRLVPASQGIRGAAGEWRKGKERAFNASMGEFDNWNAKPGNTPSQKVWMLGGQTKTSGMAIDERQPYTSVSVQSVWGSPKAEEETVRRNGAVWSGLTWQGKMPWANEMEGDGSVSQRIGGGKVQMNGIRTELGTGLSVSAGWRDSWIQHGVQLFRLPPNLKFGASSLFSDAEGMSWRGEIKTQKYDVGAFVEKSRRWNSPETEETYASLFGRRRVDRRTSWSGTFTFKEGESKREMMQLGFENRNDWGESQLKWTQMMGTQESTSRHVGWSQKWGESAGLAGLTTSLATLRTKDEFGEKRSVEWGIAAHQPLTRGLVSATLHGINSQNGQGLKNHLFGGNLDLSWSFSQNWSVVGQVNVARGKYETQTPALNALSSASSTQNAWSQNQTISLAIRYQERSGTASSPIGGSYGQGSGRVMGQVFFDRNKNGLRDVLDSGFEGAEVVLDRVYRTKTNAQGYFEFSSVAEGRHSIEMMVDGVPLPWQVREMSKTFEVHPRDLIEISFPMEEQK